MAYKKDLAYRDLSFSSETPKEDFYIFDTIGNLNAKCEKNREKIIKIRTVGIFGNENGGFYIQQINSSHEHSIASDLQQSMQVCLAHMPIRPRCPSPPYPVQVFGRLQWKGIPVIFAQIIQPLKVSLAAMLNETLCSISTLHSYRHPIEFENDPSQKEMNI